MTAPEAFIELLREQLPDHTLDTVVAGPSAAYAYAVYTGIPGLTGINHARIGHIWIADDHILWKETPDKRLAYDCIRAHIDQPEQHAELSDPQAVEQIVETIQQATAAIRRESLGST